MAEYPTQSNENVTPMHEKQEHRESQEGFDAYRQHEDEKAENIGGEEGDALQALQQENDELRDQMLRLAAEMENLRRRTARDIRDAKAYSIAQFARDMLSVSDNLTRALEAIPQGEREKDSGLNALAEGVEMTERSMLSSLERHGVKKIEPFGEKFDPNFHQAMFEIPCENSEPNIVKEVVQAGYSIGDRVLRPALVGVTKVAKNTQE